MLYNIYCSVVSYNIDVKLLIIGFQWVYIAYRHYYFLYYVKSRKTVQKRKTVICREINYFFLCMFVCTR